MAPTWWVPGLTQGHVPPPSREATWQTEAKERKGPAQVTEQVPLQVPLRCWDSGPAWDSLSVLGGHRVSPTVVQTVRSGVRQTSSSSCASSTWTVDVRNTQTCREF